MERLKIFFVVCVAAWVSFFAPFMGRDKFGVFFWILGITFAVQLFRRREKISLIFSKEEIPFWIFFAAMAGGLVNAHGYAESPRYYLSFILPIPLIYFFAKVYFQKEYAVTLATIFHVAALIVCLFGFSEFITLKNFIYQCLINNMYFNAFKGSRMISTQIHATPLGTYLLAMLPLSVFLLLRPGRTIGRVYFILSSLAITAGIMLTFSRGALIALLGVMAVMAGVLLPHKKKLFPTLIGIIMVLVLLSLLSTLLSQYGFRCFYRLSFHELSQGEFYHSKLVRFLTLGAILKDHPFFGLGFDNFRDMFTHYFPQLAYTPIDNRVPDCMYWAFLAETGLVGFTGFIVFISLLLRRGIKALRLIADSQDRLFITCVLAGLTGIMLTFLTYDGLYWPVPSFLFWSYAGILSSLAAPRLKN